MSKTLDLTQGSVVEKLLKMAIPMAIGILAVIGFNLVDTFFVSQLGTKELAAISLTFPVISTLQSITMGLGAGLSSVVSRLKGAGRIDELRSIITHSLLFTIGLVTVFAILGLLSIDPLFTAIGASYDLLPLVHEYMEIWYFGIGFLVIPMMGNAAIRGLGDAKTPALIMIIAGLVNAVLDPILIFGLLGFPAMGLKGAALSTVLSTTITCFAAIYILSAREKIIDYSIPTIKGFYKSIKKVLYVGIPAAFNQVSQPIATALLISFVTVYGHEATAAFGIYIKLEAVIMIPLYAAGSALGPFMGQNFGACLPDRLREGYKKSSIFVLVYGAFLYSLLYFFGSYLLMPFSSDKDVVSIGWTTLSIVGLSYGLQGLTLLTVSSFNSLGKPFPSFVLTMLRTLVALIPVSFLLNQKFGLDGIYYGMSSVNICVGLLAFVLMILFLKNESDNPE